VQGAASIRAMVPQAVSIFLTAESEEALIERLHRRRSDNEEQINRRIQTAREELRRIAEFEYRVVNQECSLDDTVDKVIAIIEAERCRVDWEPVRL
jgi:guanylate kinase